MQISEGIIHFGVRPRWITPSSICIILYSLRKPNSLIALLFNQNNSWFKNKLRHAYHAYLVAMVTTPLTYTSGKGKFATVGVHSLNSFEVIQLFREEEGGGGTSTPVPGLNRVILINHSYRESTEYNNYNLL